MYREWNPVPDLLIGSRRVFSLLENFEPLLVVLVILALHSDRHRYLPDLTIFEDLILEMPDKDNRVSHLRLAFKTEWFVGPIRKGIQTMEKRGIFQANPYFPIRLDSADKETRRLLDDMRNALDHFGRWYGWSVITAGESEECCQHDED